MRLFIFMYVYLNINTHNLIARMLESKRLDNVFIAWMIESNINVRIFFVLLDEDYNHG